MKRPAITPAMKLQVLARSAHITCEVCKVMTWLGDIEFDHELALVNGGAHTVENLRTVCLKCHVKKSAREHRENCKTKRIARKHSEPKEARRKIPSRPWPKRIK